MCVQAYVCMHMHTHCKEFNKFTESTFLCAEPTPWETQGTTDASEQGWYDRCGQKHANEKHAEELAGYCNIQLRGSETKLTWCIQQFADEKGLEDVFHGCHAHSKDTKKVFCLLAYIMVLFKTSFIERSLSPPYAWIILAIALIPPLPVPSFLTEHQGRWLLIHHIVPLQRGMRAHTAQQRGQCPLCYRAQENLMSPETACFKLSVTN